MGIWDEDYEEERLDAPPLTVNHPYFVGPLAFGFDPQDGDPRGGPELDRAWEREKKRMGAALAVARQG